MICPVCRAQNDSGLQCRRCRADLSMLFDLEAARSRHLARARRCLAEGTADESATAADRLRSDRESLALRATAALLRRDFAAAWQIYSRIRSSSDSSPAAGPMV